MKILIIEDDPTIRAEVADWLTFEGYDAISATNGREGVEMALTTLPNLIISDITMPELDGYGVLLELQKHPQVTPIPFIFLTARADKSFIRHGMELGADDYVTKPFTRAELLSAINARLARYKSITTSVRQEVDELKAKIARMVSHELKTPLVPLTFAQQIIERQLGYLTDKEINDLLDTMRVGTDRLQHIVQQIVYLTQVESGVLSVESVQETGSSVYVWQLMPRVVDLARRYAYRNHDAQITLDQRDNDAPVWGSTALLKHALIELLTNALNFSQEGQPIIVTQWQAKGYVWISILDHGWGMSPQEVDKAQLAFEQIDRDTKEQQGFGVGLTVAQRLVQIHGGTLQLESVVGKGTQVTLSLPIEAHTDESLRSILR